MLRFTRFILAAIAILATPAIAQQVNTGVSPVGVSDSFHESIRTGWSVRGPGWFANFGGGTPGIAPPVGGSGGGGLSGGFGFGGGGVSGNSGFLAQQGSSRSVSGTSATLTTLNGAPGYIFSGTLTPFVTEITPIVGSPMIVSESPLRSKLRMAGGVQGLLPPLRLPERQADAAGARRPIVREEVGHAGLMSKASSAERGELSVAEIRRQQTAEDAARQAELAALLAEAEQLEATGDFRGAAGMYSRAAAKVEGAQREEFLRKARQLRSK